MCIVCTYIRNASPSLLTRPVGPGGWYGGSKHVSFRYPETCTYLCLYKISTDTTNDNRWCSPLDTPPPSLPPSARPVGRLLSDLRYRQHIIDGRYTLQYSSDDRYDRTVRSSAICDHPVNDLRRRLPSTCL